MTYLENHGEIKDACYEIDMLLDDLWDDAVGNEEYNLINDEVGKILDWYSEKKAKLKYIVEWLAKYETDREAMKEKLKTLKRSLKFLKNKVETIKAPRHTIS